MTFSKKTLLLATGALAASLALSSPARADGSPQCNDVNGDAADNTECGTDSFISSSSANSVLVGADGKLRGNFSVGIGTDVEIGTVSLGQSVNADRTVVIGASAKGIDDDSVVIGTLASGQRENVTVIGESAFADRIGAVVIGQDAATTGGSIGLDSFQTIIGTEAQAGGNRAVALGYQTRARGDRSVAIGGKAETEANTVNSVALGDSSIANESDTVSVGSATLKRRIVNVAEGTAPNDVVIVAQMQTFVAQQIANFAAGGGGGGGGGGVPFDPSGLQGQINTINGRLDGTNVTIGQGSSAGAAGVAVGPGATASAGGVAVGDGASNAGHSNAIAFGPGTVNTGDNQVAVGGQDDATSRTLTGVKDGTNDFDAVNFRQLTAAVTGLGLGTVSNDIKTLQDKVAGLQGDVADLFDDNKRQDRNIGKANEGVAMAMALDSPNVPAGAHFAVTGGIGGYQGKHALATAISMAVGEMSTVSAGFGYGLNSGEVGYRAGFQFAW